MSPNRFALSKFARLEIKPAQLRRSGILDWSEDWDSGEFNLIRLQAALAREKEGAVSLKDLYEWANLLILCDLFTFRPSERETVADVVHQIASPGLHAPLTREEVDKLRKRLGSES